MTLTRRAKSMLLTALTARVVIAGLFSGAEMATHDAGDPTSSRAEDSD